MAELAGEMEGRGREREKDAKGESDQSLPGWRDISDGRTAEDLS